MRQGDISASGPRLPERRMSRVIQARRPALSHTFKIPLSPGKFFICPRLRELPQPSLNRQLQDRIRKNRASTTNMGSPSAENGQPDNIISPVLSPSAQLANGPDQTSLGQADDTISSVVQQPPKRKRPRPENPRSAAGYSRKRAVAACQSCRARKIKCNNARPACGRCLSAMIPCVYEDTQDLSS